MPASTQSGQSVEKETANATPVLAFTGVSVPENSMMSIDAIVFAWNGSSLAATWRLIAIATGSLTNILMGQKDNALAQVTLNAAIVVSGNDVSIQLTGVIGTVYKWAIVFDTAIFSPS